MNALIPLLLIGFTNQTPTVPAPRVKLEIHPKPALVGERVVLAITLYTPGFFSNAPSFDLPSVPGTVVLPPSGSPAVGSERIDGVDYTTQRHELAAFAQRPGVVQIPAFPIRFDSNEGFGTPTVSRELRTVPISWQVRSPPGTENLGTVLAARNLRVSESWSPSPTSPQVGDAFTRSVTVTADGIPGMIVPPFRVGEIPGLTSYPTAPEINDRTERGALFGQRTEVVRYVCSESGTVHVPRRTLTWYDLDSRTLKVAELPGHSFAVSPAPIVETSPALEPTNSKPALPWIAGTMVVILGLIAVIAMQRSKSRRDRTRWNLTEPALFAQLLAACRSEDPHAVYVHLISWLESVGPVSVDDLGNLTDDTELLREISSLQQGLYSLHTPPTPRPTTLELIPRLKSARPMILESMSAAINLSDVPYLNPRGSSNRGVRHT